MIPVTITPVQSVTQFAAPNLQANNISPEMANVPPGVAVLPAGSILKGFVLNRDQAGNPILRTMHGDFMLKSALFLKIGSDVNIRIESSGKNFRAAIVAVNGQAVDAQSADSGNAHTVSAASAARSNSAPVATAGTLPSDTTTVPARLSAVLLSAAPELEQLATLQSGLKLQLNVVHASFPGRIGSEAMDALTPQSALTQYQPLSKTSTAPASSSAGEAQTPPKPSAMGLLEQTLLRVLSTLPQGVEQLPNKQALLAELQKIQLPALIIGQERDGEPVVSTPLGLIKLTSHMNLPTGTQLTLRLHDISAAMSAGNTEDPVALKLTDQWPTLARLLDTLSAEPDAEVLLGQSGLIQLTPRQTVMQAAQAMGGGALLFMSMLGVGNVQEWLGAPVVKRLQEKGLQDELKKLQTEFTSLQKLTTDTPNTQNWQSVFVPVYAHGEVQMLRLFSKRKQRQENDEDGPEHIRFIVEMHLSQMGDMQLDGLVRKAHANKPNYLELIMRAHQPLPAETQGELLEAVAAVNQTGVLEASLHFQWMRQFPISPLAEAFDPPADVVA